MISKQTTHIEEYVRVRFFAPIRRGTRNDEKNRERFKPQFISTTQKVNIVSSERLKFKILLQKMAPRDRDIYDDHRSKDLVDGGEDSEDEGNENVVAGIHIVDANDRR